MVRQDLNSDIDLVRIEFPAFFACVGMIRAGPISRSF